MIRGAVAAGHPETVRAGAEALRAGGNAVDAAVAAAFASFVAEPALTGLAGGGFLTVVEGGRAEVFDFFTATPGLGATGRRAPEELDFFPITVDFGDSTQDFHIGMGSVAVPGTAHGLLEAHRAHGLLPLADLVAPARALAVEGAPLNDLQAFFLRLLAPIVTHRADGRALHAPGGRLLEEGRRFRNPALAETFDLLVREGAEGLRRGAIAQAILATSRREGGLMTAEDLARYQVARRAPLRARYRDAEVLTNPPPSAGGCLIALTLRLLENAELRRLGPDDPRTALALARALEGTNEARCAGFARALGRDESVAPEADPALVEEIRALAGRPNRMGSTTHISVLDARGNAASLTNSNGEGSGIVVPGLGLHLNNMLGEEDLHPEGFHAQPAGERMRSMMAPTVVLRDGAPAVVVGSGGSARLRSAIAQVLVQLLEFERPPHEAVHASRLHVEEGKVHVEPGFAPDAVAALGAAGRYVVEWERPSMYFGGVHTIVRDSDGTLHGAGDPRRGGVFEVVED